MNEVCAYWSHSVLQQYNTVHACMNIMKHFMFAVVVLPYLLIELSILKEYLKPSKPNC